ncbi:probable serine/threonine-protein kinase DDB_G0267514 [Ruditapes philippinarum]|uniref:probable serine/threonine-protein kinase DDB_G0267514 n=1 Tax=Ruditapes philippinarum TaxID=129788 RepID=UPI00295AA9E2|nr:probable serine/threonine-protein kinase DDB_G0267514 [Ruditapes philippinarum]
MCSCRGGLSSFAGRKKKLSTITFHATQEILTDRVRLQSLDDSTVDTAYVTEPSMEDSTVDTVTVTEPSMEDSTFDTVTVTEPSIEESTVATVTEPSMEDKIVDTVTEPSMEDSTVDTVTNPSMEDKTVDTVTERSTPSYDSITDNEVIKSHVMNENVSEQTNCDYFKERSSTAKYNPIHALNFSTDVNVPEIPYDSLCMGPKIGEGSFGTVHLAHYLFTPVAIKTVKIRRIKLVQKALEREVKVLSRVRHPHIILFMGYSVYNNALHIVSEYIKGSNLDDLLFGDRCQQIPLLKKCHIAEKICQAVAYLHNSSTIILHRDLKPENIIVSESLAVVKFCDLGISKLLTINSSATTYAPGM